MAEYPFDILARTPGETAGLLAARPFLRTEQRQGDKDGNRLSREAPLYVPSPRLRDAINTAVAVGQPLLLTGEPGVGKTQAAYYIAHALGLGEVLHFQVRSTTTARDLKYDFDAVRYMAAASVDNALPKRRLYITPRELWTALISKTPRVLLIDEIDKAPRDFPNDLLREIDQMEFEIEDADADTPEAERIVRAAPGQRPIVVVTSNAERQLPEPFLRRCVYFHIEFDQDAVWRIVERRRANYPNLSDTVRRTALDRLMALRRRGLDKPPATGELLVWLELLDLLAPGELPEALADLPGLTALVKTREDVERLRPR